MLADINVTSFLGRFHPAIVHLPIGILVLAFIFNLLSRTHRYRKLKSAVRPALFCGMLSAFASIGSGYLLSLEGGYDEALLTQHQWMGYATVGVSLLVYFFSLNVPPFQKEDRKKAVFILFFPLVLLVLLTGHWGGSLARGEDYFFESSATGDSNTKEMLRKKIQLSEVDEAEVFNKVIQPLLEEKCFSCHSSKKQKGQLRLDAVDAIQKGGKHGKILVPGDVNKSEIFKRMTLPIELKEHMPPRKEQQLTSEEIGLIEWWIKEGASFSKKGKEYVKQRELITYLMSINEVTNKKSWVPVEEVSIPDQVIIQKLQSSGVAVVPVAANSNYLSVSFAGMRKIEMKDINLLKGLDQQIIDLNLSWTNISDQDLSEIGSLKNVRLLNLGHTGISTSGINHLKSLEKLFYLNLVQTKVDNEALKYLNEMKSLRELFIFNTAITKEGLHNLNSNIKTGSGNYQLPALSSDTMIYKRK